MKEHTINKVRTVVYVANGFITGLSDLVLAVRKPNGSILTPAPTFTEQGDGVYITSYSPDTLGNYQEKISSVTNGDLLINSYTVVAYDVVDVQSQVEGVDTKVDNIQENITDIDGKIDTVQTGVTSANTKLDGITTALSTLTPKSGGYIA